MTNHEYEEICIKSFQSLGIFCRYSMKADSALLMAYNSQYGSRKKTLRSTKSLQALLIPMIKSVKSKQGQRGDWSAILMEHCQSLLSFKWRSFVQAPPLLTARINCLDKFQAFRCSIGRSQYFKYHSKNTNSIINL